MISTTLYVGQFNVKKKDNSTFEKLDTKQYKMVLSEGKCNAYEISIDNNDPPPFTDSFLTSVVFLNNTETPGVYESFIELYGTHYFNSMHLGAKYVYKFWFTNETWKEIEGKVCKFAF